MPRKTKDYWNWTRVAVPYKKDWEKTCDAEKFLKQAANDSEFQIGVTTEYPNSPRRKYDMKVITAYHYWIKDESLASWFSLKYA